LKKEVENKLTDVMPVGNDLALMKAMSRKKALPNFSDKLRERRSIRVVPVNKARIKDALSRFDGVINEIEDSIRNEMHGVLIKKAWDATPEESTCTACDFKTYCPKQYKNYHPSVP
jgi:hypothetical protein